MTLSRPDNSSISDIGIIDQPGDRAARGKVVHDPRGNAVWDWAIATGVLAGTKATELLRMLDDPSLVIEGGQLPCEWAGDPYNRQ